MKILSGLRYFGHSLQGQSGLQIATSFHWTIPLQLCPSTFSSRKVMVNHFPSYLWFFYHIHIFYNCLGVCMHTDTFYTHKKVMYTKCRYKQWLLKILYCCLFLSKSFRLTIITNTIICLEVANSSGDYQVGELRCHEFTIHNHSTLGKV